MEPDFSGYATKAGLECADGLTIMPDAFKHQDKVTVPLVWQHGHDTPENVLGHMVLENRKDGVYGYGFFNDTATAENAKTLVQHKDITALSIWANKIVKRSKQVFHGAIKEVSLVLAGANPGALIDFVQIAHGDEVQTLDDEAIIYTGLTLEHETMPDPDKKNEDKKDEDKVEHADDGQSVQEVYDTLNDDQKKVVHFMVGAAMEATTSSSTEHADKTEEGDLNHKDKDGKNMTRNVFDQTKDKKDEKDGDTVLSHDALKEIVQSAKKGGSLKAAFEDYAIAHGIDNMEVMFPDAKAVSATPDFDKRRTEWVSTVLNGTKHSPFSRIKSLVADITFESARALGYIKGNLKKEEFFGVKSRSTTPTTIYKKQKLDRDDIIDITDFDVVTWMKGEMRLMLDEEVARAILIGDGRPVEDPANPGDPNPDKIVDPAGATAGAGIRSILADHDLYAATVTVASNATSTEWVDELVGAMRFYKGSGNPTFFTTLPYITAALLQRDTLGRRLYRNVSELAAEMGVSSIVAVEVMEDVPDVIGILVNLQDYTIGSDKGGDVSTFEDFDIDYNQNKYLIETRLSGGLTKIRSAVIVKKAASGDTLVTPNAPTFVPSTGVVTIVATTGVVYKNLDTGATLSTGAQTALAEGATLNVVATPASGYYLDNNVDDTWTFTRPTS